MTNDRAIELLRRISDSQFDGPHGDERREALKKAIKALKILHCKDCGYSLPSVYGKDFVYCLKHGDDFETNFYCGFAERKIDD